MTTRQWNVEKITATTCSTRSRSGAPKSRRLLDGLATEKVSASGLSFTSDVPHGLTEGERVEIRMVANVVGLARNDTLVLATQATVVRTGAQCGAIRFEAPLAY